MCGQYGTIRTHQECHYLKGISGTQLKKPEFALMAQAFGGFGIKVEPDAHVPAAMEAALKAIDEDHIFALNHLVVEQRIKAY